MIGIVWGTTFIEAKEQLKRIAENYERVGIDKTTEINTKQQYLIEYANGDSWEALCARENCRGKKCNISYISEHIDIDMVNRLVLNCTIGYPYTGIHVY